MSEFVIVLLGLVPVVFLIFSYWNNRSPQHETSYGREPGERYPHRWGYKDTEFEFIDHDTVRLTGDRYPISGYPMPEFVPFVESTLDLEINPEQRQDPSKISPTVPEPNLDESFMEELSDTFSEQHYTKTPEERLRHSHGQVSVDEVYRVLYRGELDRVTDLVFYATSEEQIQKLVSIAHQHNVCLVPYGGGTNVTGALKLLPDEERMIVSVNLQDFNEVLELDEENRTVRVQAGKTGKDLENYLNRHGFTCGHYPDSIELSTVGGWISTNASGMKKNRYGNIEHIVLEATLMTPGGTVRNFSSFPRTSTGVEPLQLLFGSEGNLGIITEATMKVFETPPVREYGSIVFPGFRNGVEFLKELRKKEHLPASVRLVNNTEFHLGRALQPAKTGYKKFLSSLKKTYLLNWKGFDPDEMVGCTLVMEGTSEEVQSQKNTVFSLAKQFDGISGGSKGGKRGYMATFGIAYIRDFFNQFQILGETFETSAPWDCIFDICTGVEEELDRLCEKHGIQGRPYLSYRVTQTYRTGVCIYFTMGVCGRGLNNPVETYNEIEHRLREVILENGGSLSHHHGIGKIRSDFMPRVRSETSNKVIEQIKNGVDPRNIFGVSNNIFDRSEETDDV